MIMISRPPSSLVERTSDRTASSSITVPKFLDQVDIALSETKHLLDAARPGIRAGDDCDLGRRGLPPIRIVVVGDGCIGAQRRVNDAHHLSPSPLSRATGIGDGHSLLTAQRTFSISSRTGTRERKWGCRRRPVPDPLVSGPGTN